jgi:hypothetical protein
MTNDQWRMEERGKQKDRETGGQGDGGTGGRGEEGAKMMHRLHGLVGPVRVPEEYTPRTLAVWWEGIAEQYGRYPCIATLLALPADREAIRYATEFGDELDAIS